MDNCTHTEEVEGRWIPSYLDFEGIQQYRWQEQYSKMTTTDIDLHRYKCTQCGKIMYYSDKARRHFENGESFPTIKGLE